MNLTTTIETIYKHHPCSDGFAKLLNGLFKLKFEENSSVAKQLSLLSEKQKKQEVTLLQVLNINGVKDAFWVLRCWSYEETCLLGADIAESVLHVFEKKYPHDKRPRLVIDAIRNYKKGEITKTELAAVADAAYTAFDTATAYADATAHAAYVAANAVYTAVYASAVYAAANAAAFDTADADDAIQWKLNEKLMREFISN